jgi:hypothetical protein
MLPFTTWVLPLGQEDHSNRSAWRTRSVCGQISLHSARHRRERDGNDMRLRARGLSIASFAEGRPLFSQAPMPKVSSSPLIFGAGARYSLTQIIHLPSIDEVI